MRLSNPQSLESFLTAGSETTADLLVADAPMIAALREFHDFFVIDLWGAERRISPFVGLLCHNGHFYWLAAVRLALTGQMTGVFPLLRTGLEAYCYAWMIAHDDGLVPTWRDRDQSPAARKACRDAFTPAVSTVAKALEAKVVGGGAWIKEHYEATIEWGGHPNVRAVVNNLRFPEDDDDLVMTAIGLHGAESSATAAGVVACLDLGIAMAQVPSASLPGSLNAVKGTRQRFSGFSHGFQ